MLNASPPRVNVNNRSIRARLEYANMIYLGFRFEKEKIFKILHRGYDFRGNFFPSTGRDTLAEETGLLTLAFLAVERTSSSMTGGGGGGDRKKKKKKKKKKKRET